MFFLVCCTVLVTGLIPKGKVFVYTDMSGGGAPHFLQSTISIQLHHTFLSANESVKSNSFFVLSETD